MTAPPNKDNLDLAHAFGLLGEDKVNHAERICRQVMKRTPQHPGAVHLLGLIRKANGEWVDAEKIMRRSIQLAPNHAEFSSNLANLLRQQDRFSDAEAFYRRALEQQPHQPQATLGLIRTLNDLARHKEAEALGRDFVKAEPRNSQAWQLLAMTVTNQGRLGDAVDLYRQAIRVQPDSAKALHNLGSLLCRLDRPEEALATLNRAKHLGVEGYEIAFNFGRTYLQLYEFQRAEQSFAQAVAENPKDSDSQINLARVRFMFGQEDFDRGLSRAIKQYPHDPDLCLLQALVLRRSGRLEPARVLLEKLRQSHPTPQICSALAEVLHELGALEVAEELVMGALTETTADDPIVVENAVAILLARGKPERAMGLIKKRRVIDPLEQGWIAYQTTAARLLGEPLHSQLCNYEDLVRVYDLGLPSKDLLQALNQRHSLPQHPLDQSLRHGSQTPRSLLTDPQPAIRAVLESFQEPLNDYTRSLGYDYEHPMRARNTGTATITGAWSVQLRQQGLHVNHFHPEGWISSAYYVSVPKEVEHGQNKAGWIKFGEPRFPVPGATPEYFIKPKPGRLVLFPSYLWHGTVPLTEDEPRTTIAFDAKPK